MLLNYIWMYEQIPDSWKLAMMNPWYKKNSRHNTKNYRPITYLSNLFKLLERILDTRLKKKNIYSQHAQNRRASQKGKEQ